MIEHIKKIREHYDYVTPTIINNNKTLWVNPYTKNVDWCKIFSPIEEQTWMALRCFGKAPLYPQYPIQKYFVDFGNPKVKIAIECDGKEWHLDKEKDAKRDNELLNEGWNIFRISGADCFKICNEYYDRFQMDYDSEVEKALNDYYASIEGLIKAIGIFYFGYMDYTYFETEIEIALKCLKKYISPIQHDFVLKKLSNKLESLNNDYYEHKNSEETYY